MRISARISAAAVAVALAVGTLVGYVATVSNATHGGLHRTGGTQVQTSLVCPEEDSCTYDYAHGVGTVRRTSR